MTTRLSWALRALPATLALAASGGCEFLDPDPATSLTVGFARTQPATEDLGVLVVIQQRGGAFLRLRTVDGRHQLSTTAAGEGEAASCLSVDSAEDGESGLVFLTVTPQEPAREALLFVDLLSTGAGCTGVVREARLLAVSRERALLPEPQTPSEGGAAGAGGQVATGGGGAGDGGAGGNTATGGGSTGGGGMGGASTTGQGGTGTTTGAGGAGGGQ